MIEFFLRHKKKTIFILLLVFYLLLSTIINERVLSPFTLLTPIQGTIYKCISGTVDYWEGYIFLVKVKSDNMKLREELNKSKKSDTILIELKEENRRLKELLSLKELEYPEAIAARVVFSGAESLSRTIFVDKGKRDGVEEDMIATLPEGVVGKVSKVTNSVSVVKLLNHPDVAVDVFILRTRDRGIFQGGQPCTIKYLHSKTDINTGDIVISSGLGGVFPKGLRIARLSSIKNDELGLFQKIEVSPLVNFKRLDEVLILRNPLEKEIRKLNDEIK